MKQKADADMDQVEAKLAKAEADIKQCEIKIQKVEADIELVSASIQNAQDRHKAAVDEKDDKRADASLGEMKYLWIEKDHLWKEKEQLWKEKEQLRNEKDHLWKEKQQIRETLNLANDLQSTSVAHGLSFLLFLITSKSG